MDLYGFLSLPLPEGNLRAFGVVRTHVKLPQGYWPSLSVHVLLYAAAGSSLTFPEVTPERDLQDGEFVAFEIEPGMHAWPQRDAEGRLTGGVHLLVTNKAVVPRLNAILPSGCMRVTPEYLKKASDIFTRTGHVGVLGCAEDQWAAFSAVQHALQGRAAMGKTVAVIMHKSALPFDELG